MDVIRFNTRGSACERLRTKSRGERFNLAANARSAPVPKSACSCSLKMGSCTLLYNQERATEPNPIASMRATRPRTVPCRWTKSTTADRNSSLADCPQNGIGNRIDRCMMWAHSACEGQPGDSIYAVAKHKCIVMGMSAVGDRGLREQILVERMFF